VRPRSVEAVLLLLILLGFGVRVLALDKPSLWFDETYSVALADKANTFQQLVAALIHEDLHPFLYYLVLRGDMMLAGRSEFSLRFPSVLLGVLLISTTYAIVKELFSGRPGARRANAAVGLMAVGLVAFSLFLVRYSREVRGYMMSAALISLAILALLRAVRLGGRWWLAYAGLVALSWYTHYFSLFVLPAFLFYCALTGGSVLRRWLEATALSIVLFLPWVWPMTLQFNRLLNVPDFFPGYFNPLGVGEGLIQILFPERVPAAVIGAGLVLVAVGGSVAIFIRQSRFRAFTPSLFKSHPLLRRSALVFLAWIVPVVLTTIAVTVVPKFAQRYIITAIAPLLISLALILFTVLWRWPRLGRALYTAVTTVAILLSLGQTTVAAMRGELAEGDDPRSLARFLKTQTRPGDALLLAENAPQIFQYYDPGPVQVIGVHIGTDVAVGAEVINRLLATRPRHVWLVLWHQTWADPGDFALTELIRRGRMIAASDRFAGYKVWGFEMLDYSPVVPQPQPQVPLDADFGNVATVTGYDLIEHDPGVLHVISYWRRLRPGTGTYLATFALEDDQGYRYLSATQPLATWDYGPDQWPPGQMVRVRFDVNLPPDLPARSYRPWLMLWDGEAKAYLPVTRATGSSRTRRVQLADLPLTKTQVGGAPLAIPHSIDPICANGLCLLGYDLSRTSALPGDQLTLALWWQAGHDPGPIAAGADTVTLRLLGPDGQVAYAAEQPLLPAYPPTAWQPGEVNRAAYTLTLPVELNGGQYSLQAGLGGEWVSLTGINIPELARRFDLPPGIQAADTDFGGLARLAGYRLDPDTVRPGQPLTVTLYWRAEQRTDRSYHVTAQLLFNGEKMAQHDGIPAQGARPTTSWLPGEVVADAHPIAVPAGLPAGRYEILVALYLSPGGQRLPVGPDANFILLPVPHE